jgi:glyoxylase-like metal-dependent hydrolase (beta-lactamase superfamily II)
MLKSPNISRRQTLMGAAALPLASAASPLLAAAEMMGVASTRFNRVRLGAFEVTTLLAATRAVPDPQKIFGTNVSAADFAAASDAANIPVDTTQFFFTPTVVNTGAELILFDTGLDPVGITEALNAAGYSTDQIDVVVITHMHGDHIGGLRGASGTTFANARYVMGAVEFDAWDMSGNQGFENNVRPLADQASMIGDGDTVVSGITAIAAFGHTPGHMAYHLESEGRQMILGADFANHYVWSLENPAWEVLYDQDKAAAAATRVRLLDMMAADKIPFVGYHMPWPGLGYVVRRSGGYHYVPASYQLML